MSLPLPWQCYLWYIVWDGISSEGAFWDSAGDKETQNSNTDLVQTWVLGVYNTLWHLKGLGYGSVAENQVCRSKLTVTMDEHLGLQYFF